MMIVGRHKYLPKVRNLEGSGNLLIDVVVAGTNQPLYTITIPRKWPSLLDADLLPEFSNDPFLTNLSEYDKRGLADQIIGLRKRIIIYLSRYGQTNSQNP